MADQQPTESPQLEETSKPEAAEPSAAESAHELLNQLEKLNVSTPEDLTNMAQASSQSGHLANLLGDANKKIEALTQKMDGMQTPHSQEGYEYNESPDLKSIVRNELRGFYTDEVIKPQQEAQGRILGEMAQIQKDPDYGLVASDWAEHYNTPQVQQKIYSGQSSPMAEYNTFVRSYLRGFLTKTTETLKGLTADGVKTIPHVESSDVSHVHTQTPDEISKDEINKMVDPKKWQGTDTDIEKLVGKFFPKGDPLLK